jgi:hypothetical protein
MQKEKLKRVMVLISLLLILFIYQCFYNLTGLGIPCVFHKLTNLYCPGCGSTRMLFSIINLDFYQAFRYNPCIFILLLLFVIFEVINIIFYIRTKKVINIPDKVYYIVIGILIIFGIIRNLNTFVYLIPTHI